MSTPKRFRVFNRRLLSHMNQLPKRFMAWVLRVIFASARFGRTRQAGFVLPTTVLLLLILTLTVFGLSFRSFTRSAQVIASREQQTIDNIAAPAIDRAKAKLEYLFLRDSRFPGGVPSSDVLQSMMLNDGNNGIPAITGTATDSPYTFPDETRLDIDKDGTVDNDNAWVFEADVDGGAQLIAYSILMDDADDSTPPITLTDKLSKAKAQAKVTRNGPITSSESTAGCGSARSPEGGWQIVDSSTVQKNFQITAFASNGSAINRTTTALEFQQVRQADRGNKWGAWFKYDLELFPNADKRFLWNGAMHTEGNFINRGKYTARLISSPDSCLYSRDASEITLAEHSDTAGDFRGYAVFGTTGNNRFGKTDSTEGPKPDFDIHDGPFNVGFERAADAVNGGAEATAEVIERIALDPIALFTKDNFFHRDKNNGWGPDGGWNGSQLENRIENEGARVPFLDDTFRADDRYGPKPDYDPGSILDDLGANAVGTEITGNPTLTDPAGGLDGYWERQAIDRGLRLLIGQRLELGNAFGWGGGSDPLYPVNSYASAEKMQRRSLRDNLAAVQGMVVYHYESGGSFPLACVASTAHPGTNQTIINSRTFTNQILGTPANTVKVDFLEGNGTNGWEFGYNASFDDVSEFETQYDTATAPLKKSLTNLAYFAGDPDGGAPSFTPVQDTFVHPFPWMAMWGDYSTLRRIIDEGRPYAFLSSADQSTLHSAACTLGLLAYNLNSLKTEFDAITDVEWASPLSPAKQKVAEQYFQVMRDRTYGFGLETTTGICDAAGFTSLGVPAGTTTAYCPTDIKYPSLYYLFPRFDHDQFQDAVTLANVGAELDVTQPAAEEYIDATSTSAASTINTYQRGGVDVNDGLVYQVVDSTIPTAAVDNLSAVANAVRLPAAWELPKTLDNLGTFTDPDVATEAMRITNPEGGTIDASLLDKGMYDGRELLGTRILDVDIAKLTTDTNVADKWIAAVDGIVYAFREDAVREDEIVRPKNSSKTWNDCDTWAESNGDADCRIKVIGSFPFLQDPPLPDAGTLTNRISVKPVDFYGDPERRPNGFRLINGITLNRAPTELSGITFVSDNTVFIKGDFNLHTTDATKNPVNPDGSVNAPGCNALVEEFTEKLDTDCDGDENNDFYADRNTLNTATFAVPGVDVWRPSEIVGDAVGVLSVNFRDGNVADGFTLPRETEVGKGTSSYQNQNRPENPDVIANWELEGGLDTPISIDRNGSAVRAGGAPYDESNYMVYTGLPGDSYVTDRSYDQQTPIPTRTNAVFISGIIPSRAGQTYGGMHNFPRFLEYWDEVNLYISGGFFQLNFSTAATGPFDQEALEPGSDAKPEQFVSPFYGAPNRVWGYDVGLQYAPAAPISRRFVTVGRTRSEFYRELAVDDPYVENLRCALVPGTTTQVDTFANCP